MGHIRRDESAARIRDKTLPIHRFFRKTDSTALGELTRGPIPGSRNPETPAAARGWFYLSMNRTPAALALAFAFSSPLAAEDRSVSVAPASVAPEDFGPLRTQSPFLRSVNLSDSLILTGFAEVEDERVATIMNKETKETYVVSSKINSQGWRMVELKTDEDLEKVAAKVAVEGGEVVTIRYADWKAKPGESKPAAGPSTEPNGGPTAIMAARRPGFGGPGGPEGRRMGGPPPEVREKMEKLSEDQRQQLFDRMRELREKNPEMSWEERGRMFNEALERMSSQR